MTAPADPTVALYREWVTIQADLARLERLIPVGLTAEVAAQKAIDDAVARRQEIHDAITKVQATTIPGAIGKLRITHAEMIGYEGLPDLEERMLLAVIRDLERVAERGGGTVEIAAHPD